MEGMGLRFQVLGTSSSGNCSLIESNGTRILLDAGFEGWCTVEQDCDPTLDVSPVDDARANREYLETVGFT